MSVLKPGCEFTHRHWHDPYTLAPLRCRVTARRSTTIYYRAIYPDGLLGGLYCFETHQADRYVEPGSVTSP